MKISHQQHGHVSVLTLSGEYTADDVDHFRRIVGERLAAGSRHLLVDCEHLEFVDSQGLESWLRTRDEIGQRGGQFRLINPDENVAKILEITRVDKTLESHATLEAAVRSVR